MSLSRRQRLMLGFSWVAIGFIVCLLWWWQTRRTPTTIAQTFVKAVQHHDWITVAEFVHPVERQKLGLTLEKVKFLGERFIAPIWQQLGNITGLEKAENPFFPTPEEEHLYFRDTHFFRLTRDSEEGAMVAVVKTDEGWRVNFSMFIYTLLTEATKRGQLQRDLALAALRQVGISRLFIGKESMPLPPR